MLRETVLRLLANICGSDEVIQNPDVEIYTTGLLDSFGTVQFLIALDEELGIGVSISEVDRDTWATPNMIAAYLEDRE